MKQIELDELDRAIDSQALTHNGISADTHQVGGGG